MHSALAAHSYTLQGACICVCLHVAPAALMLKESPSDHGSSFCLLLFVARLLVVPVCTCFIHGAAHTRVLCAYSCTGVEQPVTRGEVVVARWHHASARALNLLKTQTHLQPSLCGCCKVQPIVDVLSPAAMHARAALLYAHVVGWVTSGVGFVRDCAGSNT